MKFSVPLRKRVLVTAFISCMSILSIPITACSNNAIKHASGVLSTLSPQQSGNLESQPAIIIPPGQVKTEKRLLILFPGMYKAPTEYESLAREIQRNSPFELWVGILKFTGNLVNPVQAQHGVDSIFEAVQNQGFKNVTTDKTFIAGHSLGGIVAQYFMNGKDFAGLILMSSYLVRSEGNSALPQATLPVFTLSGELDGQTRLTRIAVDAKSMLSLPADLNKKPVVILPKINHSQFAGTETARADLKPEIDYQSAQQQIGLMISDFMIINDKSEGLLKEKNASSERLSSATDSTRIILAPYWDAQEKDHHWCEEIQRDVLFQIAPSFAYSINHSEFKNDVAFAASKPKAELTQTNEVRLSIGSQLKYHPNVMDRSSIPEAAQTLACKRKSSEALSELTQSTAIELADCRSENIKVFEWALGHVSSTVRERYLMRGRKLQFATDELVSSGLQWLPKGLEIKNDPNQRYALVTSSSLHTPLDAPFGLGGMHYCKLLSPTRAMEWIMVDSLRD